jgi:hypothetical protein
MVAQTNGTTNHTTTELEGRVVRTNDRGLVLEGRPSWLNISKFAGDVALPSIGQVVRLTLDKSGFIRGIDAVDAQPAEPRQIRSVGAQDAPSEAPDREAVITRLAVLKAAAQFCQYRQDVDDADVLAIAERWEGWILR